MHTCAQQSVSLASCAPPSLRECPSVSWVLHRLGLAQERYVLTEEGADHPPLLLHSVCAVALTEARDSLADAACVSKVGMSWSLLF